MNPNKYKIYPILDNILGLESDETGKELEQIFDDIYLILRRQNARIVVGSEEAEHFKVLTDANTGQRFHGDIIAYYERKSGLTFRLCQEPNAEHVQTGFEYRSYSLFYPNVRISIITPHAIKNPIEQFVTS